MAPWKKLLPKSANFGKYEKEEKQKYKQYVKVEAQNAQLRSKPESEVYEDFLLLRSKSSRRSSKKRKAPAPQSIENAYKILEDRTLPSNVVVINDDLRDRFAGYEPPKFQENVYVVVQNYQDEVDKPRRLRWKKNLPTPPETNPPPPPPPPIGEAQRRNADSKSSKSEDDTHPSMSEVYFDCEDYLEIPSLEDPESSKSDKTNLITVGTFDVTDGPPNPAAKTNNSTKTNPIYDDIEEASLPQSVDVEYEYIIEDEGYCENRRVHNHYSNEPEDESKWQPSNVRFLEMSGDEEEQQIYGPYGTFEVTNYENTLNGRIQMVLEAERNSVMRSLEDRRNEEARNNVEEAEGEMFEFTGTYLDTNQDDFGVVDFEGYDEEFSLAQAKNIILIEAHEEEAGRNENDSSLNNSTDPFKFPGEVHEETKRGNQTAKPILLEDPKTNEDSSSHKHFVTTGPFDFPAKNTERHLNEPTSSNLHEEIHEGSKRAYKAVESVPSNIHEEIVEEPKRDKGGSLFKHSDHHQAGRSENDSSLNNSTDPFKFPGEVHEETKRDNGHPSPNQFSSRLSDFTAKPIPSDLREDPKRNQNSFSHKHSITTGPFDFPAKNTERHLNEPTPSYLHEEIHEDSKRANNVVEPVTSNMQEEILEESKRGKHFDHHLNEATPSNLREQVHEEPQKAKNVDLDLSKTPPSTLRVGALHHKSDNAIAESGEAENIAMGQKEVLPSLKKTGVQQAEAEMKINSHLHEKEEKNRIVQKETSPPLEEREIPQAEAETKEDSQQSSLDLFDKYSAFFNDPTLTMGPRSKLRSSETEQNNPKEENDEEFDEDLNYENLQFDLSTKPKEKSPFDEDLNYENLQFDLSTKAKEKSPLRSKKTLQDTLRNQRKPVAQPRLSLFELKPSRNIIRYTRSNDEPEGQRAITDLFNGLPVESEDLERNRRGVILKEQNKENSREPKTTTTGPFNGLPVRSRTEVNSGIHQNGNLKIPWENKTSSVDDDVITSSSNLNEEESQNIFLKIPWRTRPKTYPNDENIFANSSSSKQEEILKIPWETKPKMSPIDRNSSTFFSKSETFEKDFVHPRKLFGQAQKNPIYDTSHELFNPHDVQPSPNITDENEKDHGNFKVFWDTTSKTTIQPKMFEQNKTGSGDITNPNFDGGGIIPKKSNEDSLEKTADRTGPRFDENFRIVNDKDIIRETFSPLNKSDKVWAESRELGDNSSKPQDHALWTSNSIHEAEGIRTNLNDLPQGQTINPNKEDDKLENKTGSGDITNPNFDGGGIIPRKSNEDSLEKTSDKLDRTGPIFDENFRIVNDKDIIRETFSPLNKSDKVWAESRELGDNSSKPQDHALWTSNSIDEAEGIRTNLNDLPQGQTINPNKEDDKLENKTGSGDITNPNFDGGGIIPRKSNEDSLEKTSDKLDRTGPIFDENFRIVNDKDIIRETFSPLNKSDKVWAESRELGDNSSKPQDHALWTSNSIDEAEGIRTNLNDLPQGQTINPNKEDDKLETQNEANILEENYRILRGFNVAKEEGVVYQNIDEISTPDPVPSQLSIDKTRITKKVSFKISEVDESPNKYVPAHSPKEENGHIKKSAKLEAITRKFEKAPSLQHSMSLTEPTEKPKSIFATFPRNAGRNQSTSKSDVLERLRQVLSGISDLTSVHEQVNAMEYVFDKVKERVGRLEKSGYQDEYSELLHIMFRSVRIATVLECGFDPVLLDRQQTLLDDIKSSIATLNSK